MKLKNLAHVLGRYSMGIRAITLSLLMLCPQFTLRGESMQSELINHEDIQDLPQPVQRFLEYSGVLGSPRITQATVEQTGLFKTAPDRPWVPFTATQVYNIPEASFEWKVRMKMAPLIIVKGRDALKAGQGSMKIKLFGLIPLVNAKGPEIDQGAMTRYLSETIWFPQAFIDEHITWEAIDSLSAKAIFTIGEKSVEGVFHFNDQGQIIRFECERYATEGKEFVLRPWVTPLEKYAELGGFQLGVKGQASWKLPEGDFTYVDLEITRVVYE